MLGIFERKCVRKMFGPVKEGERWVIRKEEIKGHFTRGKYCKIDKIPAIKMVVYLKTADPTISKQIATALVERKKGRRKAKVRDRGTRLNRI